MRRFILVGFVLFWFVVVVGLGWIGGDVELKLVKSGVRRLVYSPLRISTSAWLRLTYPKSVQIQ